MAATGVLDAGTCAGAATSVGMAAGAVSGIAAGIATGTAVGRGTRRAVSGNMFMNPAGEGALTASVRNSEGERES